MKKRVLLLFVLTILLTTFLVFAQNESLGDEIDQAYSCLKDKLGDNCGDTSSTEQAGFSLLAMAYDSSIKSDCKSSLTSKEKSGNCWGTISSSSCDLKSTALSVLALNHINTNVDDSVEWLLDQRQVPSELDWYLEIDANEATTCKISVNGGSDSNFNMAENKKLSKSSGATQCLDPAESNYFLKISDSCLDDNFTISCDKQFITTLIYKKSGSSVLHISSETNSASAGEETQEKVNSYCFGTSSSCDYEGSLWASLALAKTGENSAPYIPYISAMAENNQKYIPSAFLYMLTGQGDYYSELADKQKQGKFWKQDSNEFYDTALALSALQGISIEEVDNAELWLFEIQDNSGCWHSNDIRDTAFILYAIDPKDPIRDTTGTSTGSSDCKSSGNYCVSSGECSTSSTLDNFACPFLSDVCCDVQPDEESCTEKEGFECELNQECTGSEVLASDTNYCCLGNCIAVQENDCEQQEGYSCRTECSSSQEEKTAYSGDCDFGDVCCGDKSGGGGWGLIILLIILIILIVLAIVFRNQLKIWWFRIKSKFKFKKGPSHTGRPPIPPPGTIPQLMRTPRQIIPRPFTPRRRPTTPRRAQKDNAFEDTMKKLRDMTK